MSKVRTDYVTNSSSSSFVLVKSKLPDDIRDKVIDYVEQHFNHTTITDLIAEIDDCWISNVYNLIEYNPEDDEMHIWVKRDEAMDDDFIDDILYDNDCDGKGGVRAKFDYHY